MYSIKKENNIEIIRTIIGQDAPGSEIIIFGSRASGNSDKSSDYDLLVKINIQISVAEKRSLASRIRKHLAEKLIDADIIIRDESEIAASIDRNGSVTKEAVLTGIKI